MFSKAKVKRFNEYISCAPPPTKYDPKLSKNVTAFVFEKSLRFEGSKDKDVIPGPGTYNLETSSDSLVKTPMKIAQTNSTGSSGLPYEFITPNLQFSRSKSYRSVQNVRNESVMLSSQISKLKTERDELKKEISELEQRLLNSHKSCNEYSTQVDDVFIGSSEVPEDLSCKKDSEEVSLLKEKISHLTLLRDNLERNILEKENIIADLRMQLDLVVCDAEKTQLKIQEVEDRACKVEVELEKSHEENVKQTLHVKYLVQKFEALTEEHDNVHIINKKVIDQKNLEIELLNDSISTLQTQVSEYELTVSRIQSEVTLKRSQLELTLGDLSIANKEIEVVESMLEDDIQMKNKEVSKLELTLRDVEEKLEEIRSDREKLVKKLHEEMSNLGEMKEKMSQLETSLKEKDVVQQFLEKELKCREDEVTNSNVRVDELEKELETTRKVAMDLQHEAESRLNELFCVQASMSANAFDLNENNTIEGLKEQLEKNPKVNLNGKSTAKLLGELDAKDSLICTLRGNEESLKEALEKEEENCCRLEERVMQLIVEADEQHNHFKRRLLEKDDEIEEISVKYSDALLDNECNKRQLNANREKLETECLALEASERQVTTLSDLLKKSKVRNEEFEKSSQELTHKLIHIEDALVCEEAESRELQKKLDATQTDLNSVVAQNNALNSTIEGYAAQINMLKIDMVKKSVAVDEMQECISELRGEKSFLINENNDYLHKINGLDTDLQVVLQTLSEKNEMVKDLQNELETKISAVTTLEENLVQRNEEFSQLKSEMEMLTDEGEKKTLEAENKFSEMESEVSEFSNKISQLENYLTEERDSKTKSEKKVYELEEKLSKSEKEKEELVSNLEQELNVEREKVCEHEQKIKQLQNDYECCDDQINNLQTSLASKSAEAEKWNQSYMEMNTLSESYMEKISQLKANISKLTKESEDLSSSLAAKESLLKSLDESVFAKSDDIALLHKNLQEKELKVGNLEKRILDMDSTVLSLRESRERATSRVFSLEQSLNTATQDILTLNSKHAQELEDKIRTATSNYVRLVEDLQCDCEQMKSEADYWKDKFQAMTTLIEPFRGQLDAYEAEKNALLSKSNVAEEELKKLNEDYSSLLRHNNPKQKIQHLVKIKSENNQLKDRVQRLQYDLEKQKRIVQRLDAKAEASRGRPVLVPSKITNEFDEDDKENSAPAALKENVACGHTPFRSTSLHNVNRLRRL